MRRHLLRIFATAVVAVASSFTLAIAASASTAPPATSLGYDVSFPQCGATLPTSTGFGVVGANNGRPYTINPCLVTELQWAKTSLTAAPQFYSNTADPGPSSSANWPASKQTPQVCNGSDSTSCSYDYGWYGAQNSFQAVVSAETQVGSSSPQTAAAAATWWLDVETANSWESLRTGVPATSTQLGNDEAVISGELAYFASVGAASVGIYETGYQWGKIVGSVGTTFATTQVWVPGYATLSDAQAACSIKSVTGGRVAMIQYPLNGLDGDYLCGLVSLPTTVSIPVSGTSTFSQQLSVTGETSPVTYVQDTGQPSLLVSPNGLVTTNGPLALGTYAATGTSTSASGLTGTFSVSLVVGVITQSSATSVSVPIATSNTLTSQITATGGLGALSFTQTTGLPDLIVSPSGLLSTSGTLTAGTYSAGGTMVDTSGDHGTYSLRVVVVVPTNAPPPAGVSASSLGTPTSVSVSASSATTVTLSSGGASSLLTIPAKALPAGTTLSEYPITNTASLVAQVPAGQSYVVALAISWQAPTGTSPTATAPLSLTITDPSIVAGDTIYEVTSTGLTAVGTASANGSVTITFTSDPIFMVTASALVTPVASQIVVSTQPSGTAKSGVALATQPVVTVEDASGNVVTSASGTVTATISSGTGTLTNATATITNGVATFRGLAVTGAGGSYTLAFSSGSMKASSGSIVLSSLVTPTPAVTGVSSYAVVGMTRMFNLEGSRFIHGVTVVSQKAGVFIRVVASNGGVVRISVFVKKGTSTGGCRVMVTNPNGHKTSHVFNVKR